MKKETRERIKELLIQFAKSKLPLDIDAETLRRAFPFHAVFFTDEGLRAFKNQRNIVTSMGQSLIPRIAEIIALDKYKDVHRNYQIKGKVDIDMISKIHDIINELRIGKRQPDAEKEWKEILSAAKNNDDSDDKKTVDLEVIADLYIGDFIEGPLFIEIKSPRPNLDVCAESKQKMLFFRSILYTQKIINAQAYLGLWYNPDIDRDKYSHPFTARIMDMKREVLLGEEMWNKIGGSGTYEELLKILDEVKKIIRK